MLAARSSLASWLPAGAAVALALATMAGLYATTRGAPAPEGAAPPAAPLEAPVVLQDFYGVEPGPDGLGWRWMSDAAAVQLRGTGRHWLALRALSHETPRTLELHGPDGASLRAEIPNAPKAVLLGPLELSGTETWRLRADPPATRAGGSDTRELSVFVSSPVLAGTAAAVLPKRGFSATEYTSEGIPLNWMEREASAEVVTRRAGSVSLSFDAFVVSHGGPARYTLTVSAGGASDRIVLRDGFNRVAAGPFPIEPPSTRLTLRARRLTAAPPPQGQRLIALASFAVERLSAGAGP